MTAQRGDPSRGVGRRARPDVNEGAARRETTRDAGAGGSLPWFKLWTVEWLGMTAGLSADAIALAVQGCARSWEGDRTGRLIERLDVVARLAGLDATRCRQAIDELSARGFLVLDAPITDDGKVACRIKFLEKQARRREQQAEYANRRRADGESTTNRQRIDAPRSEAQSPRGSDERETGGSAALSADREAPRPSLSLVTNSDHPTSEDARGDVFAVFNHYRTHQPDTFAKPQPESREWETIERALRAGVLVERMKLAIDGAYRSSFHRGENKLGKQYLALSFILATEDRINELVAEAKKSATTATAAIEVDPDSLASEKGWPRFRAACAAHAIPTRDALAEWNRLKASGVGAVERRHVEEFAIRLKTDLAAAASKAATGSGP